VGADTFGKLLTDTIEAAGIDTRGIVRDEDVFTTLAFVTLDAEGDRQFSFARKPGADTCLSEAELDYGLIDCADVLHFGTLSLTDEPVRTATERAVAYAKAKGKLISLDPNLRLPLWRSPEEARARMLWALAQADIVKLSEDEAEFLFGLGCEQSAEKLLSEFGVKLAFLTLGKNGCYYAVNNARGYVGALGESKAIDATGAGDIFGGFALAAILGCGKAPGALTEAEIKRAAMLGSAAAGLSTQKYGGISSVPTLAEAEKLAFAQS
jgi:sugar/nucleoside kinase (ribokinase family)